MHLTFEEGTLLLRVPGEAQPAFAWDARVDRLGRARRPLSRTSPFLPRKPELSQTRKNNL